jgi:integron integrase
MKSSGVAIGRKWLWIGHWDDFQSSNLSVVIDAERTFRGLTEDNIRIEAFCATDHYSVRYRCMNNNTTRPGALMASVHKAVRERHYSTATEEAYTRWIRRFIEFSGIVHPLNLEATHLRAFLDELVSERKVSESTHNQALCAIVFLYRVVLSAEVPWLEGLVRPRHIEHIPVVLSRDEARRVLDQLEGVQKLMASLLYGSGLRLMECMRLRIKDLDFDGGQILVRRGKGRKDRVTLFPVAVREVLRRHLVQVRNQHERDLQTGGGYVYIPGAFGIKSPNASRDWRWQWVFPATRQYKDQETGELRRHHLHETVLQRAVTQAVKAAGIAKPANCHSLRHYVPFRTMSGSASLFADMIGILDQVEKSSSRLPDIVFPGLQTVEKSQ